MKFVMYVDNMYMFITNFFFQNFLECFTTFQFFILAGACELRSQNSHPLFGSPPSPPKFHLVAHMLVSCT